MVDLSARNQARYSPIEKGEENEAAAFCDDDTVSTRSWSDIDHDDVDDDDDVDMLSYFQAPAANVKGTVKIDFFLQFASRELGGINLSLNHQGCCSFQYEGITIVLDVQTQAGAFCFYTRDLVAGVAEPTEEDIMFLNSKGYARNGLLSTKDGQHGKQEVIFSYCDHINEISAQDFLNIIINFIDTAVSLRSKLMLLVIATQEHQQQELLNKAEVAVRSTTNAAPFGQTSTKSKSQDNSSKNKTTRISPVDGANATKPVVAVPVSEVHVEEKEN